MEITGTASLKAQWIAYRAQHPKVRIRDAAQELQVSEAQLVAACTGPLVVRLKNEFPAMLHRMTALGKVMVLTRNESCVIERKGIFETIDTANKHVGLVLGKDIDLRMFLNKWVSAFAVDNDEMTGFKKSLQVFDAQGTAVIKIYTLPETDTAAWDAVVADFRAPVQQDSLLVAIKDKPVVYEGATDTAAFLDDWSQLKDTHDFYPLLMKYKVGRLKALEIAEGRFTRRIATAAVTQLLKDAAATGLEIMVFVGNPGNIEIHTGPVQKILEIPGWINVMDPDFNLHLKTTDIAYSWVVEKPAEGGVTSVEVFDATGEMIVQFFGKRKPGVPELQDWRELVSRLS